MSGTAVLALVVAAADDDDDARTPAATLIKRRRHSKLRDAARSLAVAVGPSGLQQGGDATVRAIADGAKLPYTEQQFSNCPVVVSFHRSAATP